MRETTEGVFTIATENPPVPGCTVSALVKSVNEYDVYHFSLAARTNISAESYQYPKALIVDSGTMELFTAADTVTLHAGEEAVTPLDTPVGVRTESGCVYTEIALKQEAVMNEIMKAGEVFALKDMVPYQEGRIVNMDLIDSPKLKFEVMSFAAGTGLSEHAAPGEALVFALDGQAVIGYEGKDYPIRAGENFKFAKNGRHSVRADGPFKMALLLTLE